MDELDCRILEELQRNARMTNQELADRIGLSPTPTLRRVRQLETSGMIDAYVAVVNARRLGLSVTAFIELTLASHSTDVVTEAERRLLENDAIIEAHMLAGDSDYLIKVLAEDLEAYERFLTEHLRALPALASIKTHFSFGALKSGSPVLPVSGGLRSARRK